LAKGKKTGGRQKGTPNKSTTELALVIEETGLNVPKRIIELLPELTPTQEVQALLELMNYLFPKRKAIEHTFNPEDLNDGDLLVECELAIEHFKGKAKQ
jgi:hypothetical protein